MGMRMSDRMAQFGGAMADYGDRFFEADRLRAELEKARQMEEARKVATSQTLPQLHQLQYRSEPLTGMDIANAISPLSQYTSQYGDAKAMQGIAPMIELLSGDIKNRQSEAAAKLGISSTEKMAAERNELDRWKAILGYKADMAKADKDKEMSVTQAKQFGNFRMGKLASTQYDKAYSEGIAKGTFDPTDWTQAIDNATLKKSYLLKSPEAKRAFSAADSWVETFLRDASGAAIASHERPNYFKHYFPVPGDTPETVEEKKQRRELKENMSLIAAKPSLLGLTPDEFEKERDNLLKGGGANEKKPQEDYMKLAENPEEFSKTFTQAEVDKYMAENATTLDALKKAYMDANNGEEPSAEFTAKVIRGRMAKEKLANKGAK